MANLKLQVAVRPYIAMTAYQLDDHAEAHRYLRGAGQVLDKLEASEVSRFWHERVLGRLAYEEAKLLIEGP